MSALQTCWCHGRRCIHGATTPRCGKGSRRRLGRSRVRSGRHFGLPTLGRQRVRRRLLRGLLRHLLRCGVAGGGLQPRVATAVQVS
jgi:hypothetical protein